MNWKINSLLLIAVVLFPSASSASKLVEVDELKELISSPTVKIIDVRTEEAFYEGHIPGALRVWRDELSDDTYPYDGMAASAGQMELLLGKLGVEAGNQLILYDDRALCNAARLWWLLDVYGYENVSLLNGGLKAWKLAGYELSTDTPQTTLNNFRFSAPKNIRHYASINDVKNALDDPELVIIDTRSENEFLGKEAGSKSFRKGRIPNSISIDWANTVNYEGDHRFKSIESLKKIYRDAWATADKNIIVYCQSGTRSAHTTFVLTELLGYKHVKNYDGSWIEWSYISELPIESGPVAEKAMALPGISKNYLQIAIDAYKSYADYLWHEITHPGWHNYFYWLLIVSAFFFLIEIFFPWRKDQPRFRKDFWLDFFYMFFNFFLFSLIIYNAASEVVVNLFNDTLASIGITNLVAFEVQSWPIWAHLLTGFVLRDFVQWWIHRLLHRVPFLWEFHKVHHSVEQMGFAAHLRYHWMENIVYRSLEYVPLALIGIGLNDFFIIHIFALTVGHWNHSNFKLNIGPLKYIFNNPQMHIWHHAHDLPENHPYGVNFGLTLSIWDYIFRTDYIPYDGRDIKLGFPGLRRFPHSFIKQNIYGFGHKKNVAELNEKN